MSTSSNYSRKFLQHATVFSQPQAPAIPPALEEKINIDNNFDENVIIFLSVLFCAVICFLGFFCVVQWTLKCSSLAAALSGANRSAKLAKSGIEQKVLKTFPTKKYAANSSELGLPAAGLDTTCVICLSEFVAHEVLRILPNCNHGFHIDCIDKWLASNSSCPTCRHCLIEEICQKH